MEMSWIQKHILLLLIRKKSAKVKDLLPPDVPANQFAYHLEGLVTRGFIFKFARGTYTLTPQGQTLAGTFSTTLNKQGEYIKTVVMLYGKRDDEYLLFRWSRQPYLGFVTPPHDHVPRGKLLSDGILSALDDKLGKRQSVAFKNSVLIRIFHDEVMVSHLNAVVYEVSLEGVDASAVMRNGEVIIGIPGKVEGVMNGVEGFFRDLETSTAPFDAVWHF